MNKTVEILSSYVLSLAHDVSPVKTDKYFLLITKTVRKYVRSGAKRAL